MEGRPWERTNLRSTNFLIQQAWNALPSRARSGGLRSVFQRSSLERSKRDHPTCRYGSLGGPAYCAPGCSAGKRSAALHSVRGSVTRSKPTGSTPKERLITGGLHLNTPVYAAKSGSEWCRLSDRGLEHPVSEACLLARALSSPFGTLLATHSGRRRI